MIQHIWLPDYILRICCHAFNFKLLVTHYAIFCFQILNHDPKCCMSNHKYTHATANMNSCELVSISSNIILVIISEETWVKFQPPPNQRGDRICRPHWWLTPVGLTPCPYCWVWKSYNARIKPGIEPDRIPQVKCRSFYGGFNTFLALKVSH